MYSVLSNYLRMYSQIRSCPYVRIIAMVITIKFTNSNSSTIFIKLLFKNDVELHKSTFSIFSSFFPRLFVPLFCFIPHPVDAIKNNPYKIIILFVYLGFSNRLRSIFEFQIYIYIYIKKENKRSSHLLNFVEKIQKIIYPKLTLHLFSPID